MLHGAVPFPIDDLKRAFAARELAVFLDVDGTLLEIAQRPDAVRVSTALRGLLERLLAENQGAIALVSGRTLDDLDRLFAPLKLPAAGLHGLQRRDAAGRIHRQDHSGDLHSIRRVLSESAYAGILIEDKGSAMVVHYRMRPELESQSRSLAYAAASAGGAGWQVVPGKMSFEIRVSGFGKRDAIAAFLSESPFAGRVPVFFGDDVSDEDGFEYVNECRGWSVHIGEGVATAAGSLLPGPSEVLQVIERLLENN